MKDGVAEPHEGVTINLDKKCPLHHDVPNKCEGPVLHLHLGPDCGLSTGKQWSEERWEQETDVNRLVPKCHCVGDLRVACTLTFREDTAMFLREVPDSVQREPIHQPRLLPTHLQGKVLKFPFSGSNTWFSTRANPKPMVNTARVRMKRRVTPNTAAQALNLLAGVEKGCQLWEPLKEPSPPLQKQLRVGQGIKQDPGR